MHFELWKGKPFPSLKTAMGVGALIFSDKAAPAFMSIYGT
jgi:hypothetical protein